MPKAGRTHHLTIADTDGSPIYGLMYPPTENGKRTWSQRDSEVIRPRFMTMGELTHAELPETIQIPFFQEDWQAGIGGIQHKKHPLTLADSIKIDNSGVGANLRLQGDKITPTNDNAPSEFVPSGVSAHGDQLWAFQGRYPFRWDFANLRWNRGTIPTGFNIANSVMRNSVAFEGNHYVPRWADDAGSEDSFTGDDLPSIYWYKATADTSWTASTLGNDATITDAFKYLAVADGSLWGGNTSAITDSTQNTSEKVAFDQVFTNSGTASPSVTVASVAPAGSNRIVIVGVSWADNVSTTTVSTVTKGSTSMTRLGGTTSSRVGTDIWYLVNPSVSSETVTVTMSGSTDRVVVGVMTFTNVHQSTALGSMSGASGTDTAPSVAITSVAGDMVIDVVSQGSTSTSTAGAGQTERWDINGTAGGQAHMGTGTTETATGTSTTMSETLSGSAQWTISGVAIKPITMTAAQTTLGTTDTASSNFSAGNVIRVDDEYMLVVTSGAEITSLVRGYRGTIAATHNNGVNIYLITNNAHHVHSTTDGTNTGTWSGATAIGDSSSPIVGLAGSDTDLIIAKTDGLYRLESDGTVTNLRPSLGTTIQTDQFRGLFEWNDRFLAPLSGGGMWELETLNFTIRDISFSNVMPNQTQYHGRVAALDGSATRLYALVVETANTRYHVLAAEWLSIDGVTDYRWSNVGAIDYTTNHDPDHSTIYYEAIEGDTGTVHDRIIVGVESTNSDLVPVFFPLTSNDVQFAFTNDTSSDDRGQAIADTTRYDGNLPSVSKRAQEITVETNNLGTSVDTGIDTSEALDTTETGIDVDANPTAVILVNDIIVIDSEKMLVTASATGPNLVTVTRGYAGSTAATHSTNANIFTINYIEVQYRIDGGSYTYITGAQSTSTLVTSPQTIAFASNITGRIWEMRYLFQKGTNNTNSPELTNFTGKLQLRPDSVRLLLIQAYLADNQSLLNGARESRSNAVLAQLKSWNDGVNEVAVVFDDQPGDTTSYTAVFLPGSLRIDSLQRRPKARREYVVNFVLAEVG